MHTVLMAASPILVTLSFYLPILVTLSFYLPILVTLSFYFPNLVTLSFYLPNLVTLSFYLPILPFSFFSFFPLFLHTLSSLFLFPFFLLSFSSHFIFSLSKNHYVPGRAGQQSRGEGGKEKAIVLAKVREFVELN